MVSVCTWGEWFLSCPMVPPNDRTAACLVLSSHPYSGPEWRLKPSKTSQLHSSMNVRNGLGPTQLFTLGTSSIPFSPSLILSSFRLSCYIVLVLCIPRPSGPTSSKHLLNHSYRLTLRSPSYLRQPPLAMSSQTECGSL